LGSEKLNLKGRGRVAQAIGNRWFLQDFFPQHGGKPIEISEEREECWWKKNAPRGTDLQSRLCHWELCS